MPGWSGSREGEVLGGRWGSTDEIGTGKLVVSHAGIGHLSSDDGSFKWTGL